jgi:hypothetical protein
MNWVLGIGSNFSISASVCGSASCASSETLELTIKVSITKDFIGAFDTPNRLRLQGGRCAGVFIFCRTSAITDGYPWRD